MPSEAVMSEVLRGFRDNKNKCWMIKKKNASVCNPKLWSWSCLVHRVPISEHPGLPLLPVMKHRPCEGMHDGQMFLALYFTINTLVYFTDRKGSLKWQL